MQDFIIDCAHESLSVPAAFARIRQRFGDPLIEFEAANVNDVAPEVRAAIEKLQ